MRAPNRSNPYYQKIDALADQGAHRTFVRQVQDLPRVYGGQCFDCDWLGNEAGKQAMEEMLAHTESTHPLAISEESRYAASAMKGLPTTP